MDDIIRECFPHPTFRPGQFEFIKEAIRAFEGGAKNVIVEAPTGTGKTPGIIAIARYYTRAYDEASQSLLVQRCRSPAAKREEVMAAQDHLAPHQAHLITSLKMLQDQYLRDDGGVQIMKGKNNYLCHAANAQPHMSCHDYELMFGGVCKNRRGPCVYAQARLQAQLAQLTLHNFDSFMNQVTLGGSFLPRALLSIDEAHGADDKLINAIGFELSRETLFKLEVIPDTSPANWREPSSRDLDDSKVVGDWLAAKDQLMAKSEASLAEDVGRLQDKMATGYLSPDEQRRLGVSAKRKNVIADLRRRLGRYLASRDKVPWAVSSPGVGVLRFEPVKSSFFARSALLDYGQRRLLMSATIFDKGRRIMSALNLKREETHYIAVPCIFPVTNRPLVDLAVADTGATHYDRAKPQVFAAIQKILDRHPNERGVIHCNSYQMAKDVREHVRSPRLVFHESSTREATVNEFMTGSRSDSVLVGVFLREGYDFKDDIARFQVLVRLPFHWPTKRKRMRDDIEKGYYDFLCAIDLVQTYGRGVRNEQDHCVTYCLDARLRKFLKRAGYMMPGWFLDAVRGDDVAAPASEPAVHDDFFDLET